jgi:anaphase-promoting complex subunit 2
VWTLDELMPAVGSVARSAAVKALATWVDMGVLKEDPENTFILLEKKEEIVARQKTFGESYLIS